MKLTKLQQSQVSGSLSFNDKMVSLTGENRTLIDDLNSLRTQIRKIQGTDAWTDNLSGSQDLADIYAAMRVNGDVADFQNDVYVADDAFVSGSFEVAGPSAFLSDLSVGGDLEVQGGKITMSNGAIIDSETAGELKLTEDLVKVSGDLEVQGGKVTMSNGAVIDSETAGELKLTEDLVKVTGDFEVQGGKITMSNGAVIDSETAGELKLDEDLVKVTGDLEVQGGKVTLSNGAIIDSETAGELKLTEDLVKVTGDFEVQGGKITMSNGAVIDSETAGELKLTEDLVKVSGDFEVQGGKITMSNGAVIDSETAGELKLDEDLVKVTGDLQVGGDDIKSSAGVTAITLAGANVITPGNMTVMGDLVINGATTTVNTTNLEVKDAIIGLGYASGSSEVGSGDRGFVFSRNDDNVAALWDETAQEFRLIFTANTPSDVVLAETGWVDLHANNMVAEGDFTVKGGKITMSNGAVIDSETAGELKLDEDLVKVSGDFEVQGGKITMSNGAVIDSETAGELKLTEDLVKVSGDFEVQGGKITMSNGAVIDSETAGELKLTEDLVKMSGDLEVQGGKITMSNGAVIDSETAGELKLDEDLVKVSGDFEVQGGKITMSNGAVIDSEAAGELKLTEDLVKVSGDFEVQGGKITMSNGAAIDSETAGELKLDEDLVKVTGDFEVQGGKITMSNGAVIDSETEGKLKLTEDLVEMSGDLHVTGGEITLSNGASIDSKTSGELVLDDVLIKVTGDLQVEGGNIKSSTGDTVFTLAGTGATVAGNLVVSGDFVVNGDMMTVNTTNLEVKDAIVGFGYASGSAEEVDGDRGFIFSRNGDNTTMFWDDSAQEFKFAFTSDSPSTGSISTTSYADFRAGIISSEMGFSGSLTHLVDGSSYMIAGVGISISTGSNGAITISGASNSYNKGYLAGNSGHISAGVLDFAAAGFGTLSSAVDKNVDVYLNGALLAYGAGRDVTAITTTTVTLDAGLAGSLTPDDVITVVLRSLA